MDIQTNVYQITAIYADKVKHTLPTVYTDRTFALYIANEMNITNITNNPNGTRHVVGEVYVETYQMT